jgi:hypothetical protein
LFQLFHHSGFQPFADNTDQAAVGNAFFQHFNQPVVIDVIKEPSDVRFDDPPVFAIMKRLPQFLGGEAWTASGAVSDAFVSEVVFPYRFKDHPHSLLHNLIFQHGDA